MADPRDWTDAEIVRAIIARQSGALVELQRRHGARVMRVIRKLVGDRTVAGPDKHDVNQEFWLKLAEYSEQMFESFEQQRPIGPWLCKVASNFCIDALRAYRRSAKKEREAHHGKVELSGPHFVATDVDRVDPAQLRALLKQLEPRWRITLEALFGLGDQPFDRKWTVTELSACFGWSRETVRRYYRRGLQALRALINPAQH